MAKLELVNDASVPRVQHYPDKDGVFAMVGDIGVMSPEHYRGTDHTAVVAPVPGDYTLETSGTWYFVEGTWKQDTRPAVAQGSGEVLYFTSRATASADVEELSPVPDLSGLDEEGIFVVTANTPVTLAHRYVSSGTVGRTNTSAGQWSVSLFARADDTTHTNQLMFDVGTTDGITETYHFTLTSPSINTNVLTEFRTVVVQPEYACASMDRYVVRVRANSSTNGVQFHWAHSSPSAYSFLTTPAQETLHNVLPDVNTGELLHVTPTELAKLQSYHDRYRGTDYATVVDPSIGDWVLQTITTWDGTVIVRVDYVPEGGGTWKRTTPMYFGTGFDTTVVAYAATIPFEHIGFCPGDVIQIQMEYAAAGTHTETYEWSGMWWIDVSNSDYRMELYGLGGMLGSVEGRVSALELAAPPIQHFKGNFSSSTALDAVVGVPGDYATYEIGTNGLSHEALAFWDATAGGWMETIDGARYWFDQSVRDSRAFVGTNRVAPSVTPTVGAYTVEADGVWVFDGTGWKNFGVKHWTESNSGWVTQWTPNVRENGTVVVTADYPTVTATRSGYFAGQSGTLAGDMNTIVGGYGHSLSGGSNGAFAGTSATISGWNSVVIGGNDNSITSTHGVVLGGQGNEGKHAGAIVGGSGGVSQGANSFTLGAVSGQTARIIVSRSQSPGLYMSVPIFTSPHSSQNWIGILRADCVYSDKVSVWMCQIVARVTFVAGTNVYGIENVQVTQLGAGSSVLDLNLVLVNGVPSFTTTSSGAVAHMLVGTVDVTLLRYAIV